MKEVVVKHKLIDSKQYTIIPMEDLLCNGKRERSS